MVIDNLPKRSYFREQVLSPRIIFIYILLAAGSIVVDSIALRIIVNLQEDLTVYMNLAIFTGFVLIFVFMSYIFLNLAKEINPQLSKLNSGLSLIYISIACVQSVITFILLIIIAQLLFSSYYIVILVFLLADITHLSSLAYTAILIWQLFRWYKSRRSYIVLLYAISFSAMALTILSSLVYGNYQLSNYSQYVTLAEHVSPDIWQIKFLSSVYTQLSMISFVSTWLATVLLLRQYLKRIGIIKYWALVCIPVVYFFFPFFAQSFGILEQL